MGEDAFTGICYEIPYGRHLPPLEVLAPNATDRRSLRDASTRFLPDFFLYCCVGHDAQSETIMGRIAATHLISSATGQTD